MLIPHFRREVPTQDGGWVIVTSDPDGIRIAPDAHSSPVKHVTPAQALALADALTTANRHQSLTITRKDPS